MLGNLKSKKDNQSDSGVKSIELNTHCLHIDFIYPRYFSCSLNRVFVPFFGTSRGVGFRCGPPPAMIGFNVQVGMMDGAGELSVGASGEHVMSCLGETKSQKNNYGKTDSMHPADIYRTSRLHYVDQL